MQGFCMAELSLNFRNTIPLEQKISAEELSYKISDYKSIDHSQVIIDYIVGR